MDSDSDSDAVYESDCGFAASAAFAAVVACHSRQQLSQLIGFRFISSIFPDPSRTYSHTYVVIYCAKILKKKKKETLLTLPDTHR